MNRFLFISIKLVKRTYKLVLPLFYFFTIAVNSQDFTKQIEGHVFSEDGDVAAVHVSNISINRGTITDIAGYFKISGRLNDTLVFSAVQFQRVEIVVTLEVWQSDMLNVSLKQSLTELDEVVVMPYNLTGDLNLDMGNLKIQPIVTASTLGLPNASIKVKTQNERKLFEADNGKFIYLGSYKLDTTFNPTVMINFNKILNRVTGRTKKLKKYVAIDKEIALLRNVRRFNPDSVYVQEFDIPKENLIEFFYFCMADSSFASIVKTEDKLKVWEYLQNRSHKYHTNNKHKLKQE